MGRNKKKQKHDSINGMAQEFESQPTSLLANLSTNC